MSPLIILLLSFGGTAITATAGGLWIRNRTAAETSKLDADSADVLSQAAARLIPLYDSWLKAMETRLTKAEETAARALERESLCLARIVALQGQIDELRRQIEQPAVTTITATAVTSHPAVDPAITT